jgi:hypothetical protein
MRYILEVNEHVEPEARKIFSNAISDQKPRTPS